MRNAVLTAMPEREAPATGIEGRTMVANALTGVLADSYVLMVKTQGYHWNVVGPLFQPIHVLTETHYRDLFEAIDTMAERVRALGEVAPLAFTDMLSEAVLAEEETQRSAECMIRRLVADHETLARRLRDLAELAAGSRDGATEDLANSRMAFHEEAAWMLRATVAQ
ncbi:MAG: DNA starvation/stationary phase protection protein [Pseudomonadota bacterium]